MSKERWQDVWTIFEAAIQQPEERRQAFLNQACAGNARLRRAVEDMLLADEETDSFLDVPLGARGGGVVESPGEKVGGQLASGQILARGTKLGPYRILRLTGQGGMSTVYLAERADDVFPRRVAVKLVRPGMESASIVERLRIERRILASLEHPNIARLYDGGSPADGLPYFVREYVEGVPIDAYCEQNQLSVDERLTLFRKVCEPVHYAHQNLIVHRDIKPSNILVGADGEPKLLDFGIAKLLNPELADVGLEPTQTWQRALTPNYASPEQIRGQLVTTASDVYSLGVLLYQLLTGRLPHSFVGRTPREIENLLTDSEPLPPSVAVTRPVEESTAGRNAVDLSETLTFHEVRTGELRRQLAGDLDAIVLKALRVSPRHRYGSVERLSADIERYRSGLPVTARAGSWRYLTGKFVRRNLRGVALAAAVALVVVGFAVAMALQADRVAFERDQARLERDKKSQVLSLILQLFEFSSPYVLPGEELTVREALRRSVPLMQDALRDQPEVRAELLHSSGSILNVLYESDDARDQLREALAIRRELHGADHPEVVRSMSALAAAYRDLGEYEEAETLARGAVETARRLADEGAADIAEPLLAETLNRLVSVMCYQSQYLPAQGLAEEALAVARQLPSAGEGRVSALEQLAIIRNDSGDYQEAADLRRESLKLQRKLYGERHPGLIPSLNNLGLSLRRLEEFEESESIYRLALDLQLENFGEEHPDLFLLNNLAALYYAMGNFESAEEIFRQGRAAAVKISGARHWKVFSFDVWIARTRIRQGAAKEAEQSLRFLMESWRSQFGDHWRMDIARNVLGLSVSAQGRCAEAEPLLVESFERLLKHPRERTQRDAFWRLREHFERCGQPEKVPHFEAMLVFGGSQAG